MIGQHAHTIATRSEAPSGAPGIATPHAVKPLDGLRALAALSVLFYHSYGMDAYHKHFLGWDITIAWYYMQTGVHLFFVLSGFLLFLPFARALLCGTPRPSTRAFYRRRALRMLPAYWVCLALLALFQWSSLATPLGLANIASHVVLLHDLVPDFNRAIEGPFWTLALEAQFYLLLPLLAWGIARVVGASRSTPRLCAAVVGLIVATLGLRELDAWAQQMLPHLHGVAATLATAFVILTLGSQGKFLEVFGVGMLCATLYVAFGEQRAADAQRVRMVGWSLLALAVTLMVVVAPLAFEQHVDAPNHTLVTDPLNLAVICGPLLIGLGYGALLLAILWAGPLLRAPFEFQPLVFIGLMSYSLYLWHLPFVHALVPGFAGVPVPMRVATAFAAAYLSYRLVEVPFLRRRQRVPPTSARTAEHAATRRAGEAH